MACPQTRASEARRPTAKQTVRPTGHRRDGLAAFQLCHRPALLKRSPKALFRLNVLQIPLRLPDLWGSISTLQYKRLPEAPVDVALCVCVLISVTCHPGVDTPVSQGLPRQERPLWSRCTKVAGLGFLYKGGFGLERRGQGPCYPKTSQVLIHNVLGNVGHPIFQWCRWYLGYLK